MKRTFLDRFIGFFSPRAEADRIRSRILGEANLRAYDIAKSFSTSDWISANSNNANNEIKGALVPGRNKARSLIQNNPYALKAVNVIVNETVGTGIVPNMKGRNKTQTKILQELWKEWAETTLVDYEGMTNFYGLQALVLRSAAEAGEGLALRKQVQEVPKIQLLEADHIDSSYDTGNAVQGILLDENGRRKSIRLFKNHPGGHFANNETVDVPAKDVMHVFKKERAGQQRGITWFHAVVEKLKDLEDYQNATLIGRKIAACFTMVITTTDNGLVDASALKAKREAELSMSPGQVRYLGPNEDIKTTNPPAVDGYSDFTRETLRGVSSGVGIAYESLTGDYSQSNYSSSRMGKIQERKNIEAWRWGLLIPQFCEPAFELFLEYARIKGVVRKEDKISVKWVAPAFSMIDPSKEIKSLKEEVRSGFKSYGEAVLEQGRDPDEVLAEIQSWNQKIDEKKIVLDTDPRLLSQIGIAQAQDPTKITEGEKEKDETNEEDASDESDSGSDQ